MTDTLPGLFDALCLRWAREADLVLQESGRVEPTLVVLPRDASRDEVAIRLEGLRGNLAGRADAILADLRPAVAPHDPAGLVFLSEMRIAEGVDGVAVYVTLGQPAYRRALGYVVVPGLPSHLERAASDPDTADFAWLDRLLARPAGERS